jgi:hypothetical protein
MDRRIYRLAGKTPWGGIAASCGPTSRCSPISGTLDSRTPPSNAEEALSGFSHVHHLLIVGGAHDDDLTIATGAIGEAIVRFLETGDPGRERVELPPL